MIIIIKFILTNIREKKLRTLLIVVSVAAACALFFASFGISDSYRSSTINMLKSSFGSAEIYIYASPKSPSTFLKTERAEALKDRADYVIGEMDGSGIYDINKDEAINVSLKGIDFDDLTLMNPVKLLQQTGVKPFVGNKIILSDNMAKKYGFKIGNKIKIRIGEKNEVFSIVAIAEQASVFKMEKTNMAAVIPRETMSELYSAPGKVSTIYIKPKNLGEKEQLIKELSEDYKDYNVRETINQKELDQELQSVTTSFMMMLAIVLVMSIFIIYTAFKIIITERMPIIGTFRSIGATKRTTNLVLIAESIVYGILGGALGDMLGIVVLYVVGVLMNPYNNYIKATLEFRPVLLIEAFIFGVFVSFISALIPIRRVSKVSIKDIVLNNVDAKEKKKRWKIVLSILLIVYSVAIVTNPPKNTNLIIILDLLAVLSIVTASIFIIPYVNKFFAALLEFLYSFIFGNEGTLAAKNLRNNKSILNNICLLCIGISALLMINVVSFSMSKEVTKAYTAFDSDIIVMPAKTLLGNPIDALTKIAAVDGVTGTAGTMDIMNAEVELSSGTSDRIFDVGSIDSSKFHDYINVEFSGLQKTIPKNFDEDRNIMITSQLQSRFNVKEGETLTLKTNSGKKEYRVVAIFNTIMQNGSYAFIPSRYMKNDFKVKNYNMIFVKTDKDKDYVKDKIKEVYKGKNYFVDTVSHMEEQNAENNEQQMSQIRAFPFISLIIGTFGVINNFILNFIDRRRSFAVLASIGMSKRQNIKILFIEGLSSGIIGGIMGIATGVGITFIVPSALKAMQIPLPMDYSLSLFVICFVLSVVITLISSAAPAFKSSRMNIIEAIKFE